MWDLYHSIYKMGARGGRGSVLMFTALKEERGGDEEEKGEGKEK